jgi:hypothetical protein
MALPDPQDERHRRSVRLALAHALFALGFLALFVWVQVHR